MPGIRTLGILATAALAVACAGPTAKQPQRPPVPVREALAAGTLVGIAPPTILGDATPVESRVVGALLREALRQSARLDFAPDSDGAPIAARIVTTVDARVRSIATSLRLVGTESPDVPLASTSFQDAALTDAIDTLTADTRAALGDPTGAETKPVGTIYTREPRCIVLTERARDEAARGRVAEARKQLERARRADPGCTVTLAALANAMLDAGLAEDAAQQANQTLRHFDARTAPTTRTRLARTLLLARAASGNLRNARARDEELLQLGAATLRERPHDPHARFTHALALNYLGRFEESAPELRALHVRWPHVGGVAYHRAFAELATGNANAALDVIRGARRALPREFTMLPMAIAMYHADETPALRGELERMLEAAEDRTAEREVHELRRMLAALALLDGRRDDAARILLDDLDWLRHHVYLLGSVSADLAETGEVLVRLGRARELAARIESLQPVATSAAVSQALTYVAGLILVTETNRAPDTALATLEQSRQLVWSTLLKAAVHRRRGELVDETRELATAVRISDGALVRENFSRALNALGRDEEATALLADLRKQLLTIDLRRASRHPVLSPGRALAFLATR